MTAIDIPSPGHDPEEACLGLAEAAAFEGPDDEDAGMDDDCLAHEGCVTVIDDMTTAKDSRRGLIDGWYAYSYIVAEGMILKLAQKQGSRDLTPPFRHRLALQVLRRQGGFNQR